MFGKRYATLGISALLLAAVLAGCGPKYKTEAEKKYREAAEKGDVNAQFRLAMCYYNGDGVPRDHQQAVSAAEG